MGTVVRAAPCSARLAGADPFCARHPSPLNRQWVEGYLSQATSRAGDEVDLGADRALAALTSIKLGYARGGGTRTEL